MKFPKKLTLKAIIIFLNMFLFSCGGSGGGSDIFGTDTPATENPGSDNPGTETPGNTDSGSVTENSLVLSSVIIGDNFEDSAIGDKSYGWYTDYSSVETECVFSGKKSLKLSLNQGRESPICGGNSNYGWRIALPAAIPEGYNIWYSAKFYFPSTLSLGYVFQSSDYDEAKNQCGSEVSDGFGWLKFMVLGPDHGSGSTARLYYQLPSRRRDVGSNSGVRLANEPASNILDSNFTIPRNKWVTFQMHVFVTTGV